MERIHVTVKDRDGMLLAQFCHAKSAQIVPLCMVVKEHPSISAEFLLKYPESTPFLIVGTPKGDYCRPLWDCSVEIHL